MDMGIKKGWLLSTELRYKSKNHYKSSYSVEVKLAGNLGQPLAVPL